MSLQGQSNGPASRSELATNVKSTVATPDAGILLAINGGSSSIRFALYDWGEPLQRRLSGKVDRLGLSGTTLTVKDATGRRLDSRAVDTVDRRSAVLALFNWLETQPAFASVKAVGHRVIARQSG